MTEAAKVYRNLRGDHQQVARYIVERCGDFIYDAEREALIAEFLIEASLQSADTSTDASANRLADGVGNAAPNA